MNMKFPFRLHEQKRIGAFWMRLFPPPSPRQKKTPKDLQNARGLLSRICRASLPIRATGGKKTLDQVSITFGRGKSKHRPRNEKNTLWR